MGEFYVYVFLRENLLSPYYVGKGKGKRCSEKGGRNCNLPARERIRKVAENLSEDDALELEALLIKFYGRKCDGGILQNISEGYDKPPSALGRQWSPERRQEASERAKRDKVHLVMAGKGGAPKGNHNRRAPVPVVLDGVSYPSQSAAAEALGVSRTTIINWTNK